MRGACQLGYLECKDRCREESSGKDQETSYQFFHEHAHHGYRETQSRRLHYGMVGIVILVTQMLPSDPKSYLTSARWSLLFSSMRVDRLLALLRLLVFALVLVRWPCEAHVSPR